MRLYNKLIEYSDKEIMPMHMPGHKRNTSFSMVNPYSIDITEVDGMDDLHDPKGIIRELMNECRDFYGTKDTYLSVNGSTAGNLIAIASCCPRDSMILADEICHRSVPHAVDILGLECDRINRPVLTGGVPGPIDPSEVKNLLKEYSEKGTLPSAVIVTSPTYEGVVSDIKNIAETVHEFDIPFIVDAAHGAHLMLAKKASIFLNNNNDKLKCEWPEPATESGADIVVESLHKTLPSLTQTAVLHRCSDRISDEKVNYYHDVFVSSSPSYILMASIDKCMQWQEEEGTRTFTRYDSELNDFYEKKQSKTYEKITAVTGRDADIFTYKDKDPSKIVLVGDGSEIASKLRENSIEPELVKDGYVVLMTSVGDVIQRR